MKRSLIVGVICALLFVVISAGFVSGAITCSDANQKLFGFSAEKNAHAEQWDGSNNYPWEVCFDNIFDNPYSADGSEHACADDNIIFKLAQESNSHIENADGVLYPIKVCYGDLTCVFKLKGSEEDNCKDIGTSREGCRIAFISGLLNAHGSLGDSYQYELCCASDTMYCICNYNGICEGDETIYNCEDCCNYDGICDPGEDQVNCPDCFGDPEDVCGDGILNPLTEECDDGCIEPGVPEGCDEAPLDNGDGCEDDCKLTSGTDPECGNGVPEIGEGCDDGNTENGDGCDENCQIESGDYVLSCEVGSDSRTYMVFEGNSTNGCSSSICEVGTCEEVNWIPQSPPDSGRSTLSFKEWTCINCDNLMGDLMSQAPAGADNAWCEWNSASGIQGMCEFKYSFSDGTECGREIVDQTSCGPGVLTRTITYHGVPDDPDCGGEWVTEIPCPRSVELPFFGVTSLIVSLVVIALIYIFFIRKGD